MDTCYHRDAATAWVCASNTITTYCHTTHGTSGLRAGRAWTSPSAYPTIPTHACRAAGPGPWGLLVRLDLYDRRGLLQ